MVFPERGPRHSPLSPIDGKPMKRASRSAVLALLEPAPPSGSRLASEEFGLAGRLRVTAAEFIDAAATIDDLLLARIERVARRSRLRRSSLDLRSIES